MRIKNLLIVSLVSIFTFNLFAIFEKGDLVELSYALNGRSSMNYYAHAKNVIEALPAGTKGEVLESVLLQSGNYGIKMKHPNNKTYWVYYNVKNPGIHLYDKKTKEIDNVEEASGLKLKHDQDVLDGDVAEKNIVNTIIDFNDNSNNENSLSRVGQVKPKQCAPKVSSDKRSIPVLVQKSNVSSENIDFTKKNYPLRESYRGGRFPTGTKTINGIDYRFKLDKDNKQHLEGFTLTNKKSSMIPSHLSHADRVFSFENPDLARSDMKLVVQDHPNKFTSNATYNVMMFFPRNQLPQIEMVENEKHVTLPTGEKVIFDKQTNEIKGGVLKEKPLKELPGIAGCDASKKACGKKAIGNPVSYQGQGVVLTAHKSGDLPFGDGKYRGQNVRNLTKVNITKGNKNCTVVSDELWRTSYATGATVHFKYPTDSEFDAFLKKRCGFSIN